MGGEKKGKGGGGGVFGGERHWEAMRYEHVLDCIAIFRADTGVLP